jgi:uncharacterized protein YukE
MTHKDDASFLPGNAPQLATLADPVYNAVNSRVIEDLATRFTVAGGQVVAVTDKLKSVIAGVDGAWDGASADSFITYMNSFVAAGQAVSNEVNNAATDLRIAGTALEGVRDTLEGIFANLVTEVQALEEQSDEKINELVERYRPQVQEQLNAANEILTGLGNALAARVNQVGTKFGDLSDPDTDPFTPKSGQPMDWHPTAPPQTPAPGEPQTDTPQSESPQPGSPQPGSPQPGSPSGGTPQTTPQSESPQPGDPGPQPGSPQPGTPQPGTPQPGDPQAGSPQPGSPQTGEPQTGDSQPGEPQPGDPQAGADEAKTNKILDAARGELGYEEGPNNENKYGPPASWCSSFATWTWRQAGVDIPLLPFTGDVYNWGVEHGLAYDSGNLGQARPGDVLLFGTGPESPETSTHIGVVESVDGDKVTLIEGNSSDRVQRVSYSLSSGKFYGGVHPQ